MNILKRLISAMLAIILILPATSAYADESGLESPLDSSYENPLAMVSALEIMTGYADGTMQPDNPLTRAEMCSIIINIVMPGFKSEGYTGKYRYIDVPESHWAFNQISIATDLGLVTGYDNKFDPDTNLTYEQAAKIIIGLLGYDYKATATGDYPTGYIYEAQRIGLLRGISVTGGYNTPIPRKDVARIIYNSFEIPVLTQIYIGGDTINFEEDKNVTMLSVYFNSYLVKGQVTANDFSSINGFEGVKDGCINIYDDIRKTNVIARQASESQGADNLLGLGVTALIKDKEHTQNGDYEIIYIARDDTRYPTMTLTARELQGFDGSRRRLQYSYDDGDSIREISISRDIEFVVNGAYSLPSDLSKAFGIKNGQITLISSKNSSSYDLAIVESFYNIVLKTKNAITGVFTDQYDPVAKAVLDFEDSNTLITLVDKNGKPAMMIDVNEYSVLSVYESEKISGKKKIKVVVSNTKVKGKIDAISSDYKVVVDGVEYRMSPYFADDLNGIRYFIIGTEMTVCLDASGEVCGVVISSGFENMKNLADYSLAMNYGYMTALGGSSPLENNQIKIFTVKAEWVTFEFADKVLVNDAPISGTDIVKYFTDNSLSETRLVKFKTNSENKIRQLAIEESAVPGAIKDSERLYLDVRYNSNNAWIGGALGPGGEYFSNSQTAGFILPLDLTKEKAFTVAAGLSIGRSNGNNVDIFDVSDRKIAGAFVCQSSANYEYENDDPSYIIKKISTVYDAEEGIGIKKYTLMKKDSTEAIYTLSEIVQLTDQTASISITKSDGSVEQISDAQKVISENSLAVGDIVQIIISDSDPNEIVSLKRLFSLALFREDPNYMFWESGRGGGLDYAHAYADLLRFIIGYSVDKDSSFINVKINISKTGVYKEAFHKIIPSNAWYKIITVTERPGGDLQMSSGSLDDIKLISEVGEENASLLFFKHRYDAVHDLYIFNLEQREED